MARGRTQKLGFEPTRAEREALEAAIDVNDRFYDADSNDEIAAIALEALAISPLCADAFVNLALYKARGPAEALVYWQAGVQAGASALSATAFAELRGDFLGLP